ncbi:MAG TPA: glycosyltransferase family 4 protein [Terriglobales bacterium]|nr:glycosyltransferase family 4 protein [Terriglobales bacterium]
MGSSGAAQTSVSNRSIDGRLLFVGGYNGANVDGLRRFLSDAWPEILRRDPRAHLRVCGYVCRGFSGERFNNVTFLGYQESVESEYAEATVVINPAWIGTGLKIKSVEALARGKPLVTTPKGIDGLPDGIEQCASIARDDKEFASAVLQLLCEPAYRKQLAQSANTFATMNLNKRTVYRELLDFLDGKK